MTTSTGAQEACRASKVEGSGSRILCFWGARKEDGYPINLAYLHQREYSCDPSPQLKALRIIYQGYCLHREVVPKAGHTYNEQ